MDLPAKQHCQFSPFCPMYEINGLDWHCCLAGISKTVLMIFFCYYFAKGADYSYEVNNSKISPPTFFKHDNFIYSYRVNTLPAPKASFTRTLLACTKGRVANFYFSFGKMKRSVLGLVLIFGLTCVQSSNLEIPSLRKESELVTRSTPQSI